MIRLRPHHFLCTVAFQGRGYSPAFVANYRDIFETLNNHKETLITVAERGDDVCRACPHQRGADLCDAQETIDVLDRAHERILSIVPGDVISWQQALDTLKKNMTLDQFHQACAPCSWKKIGICERALLNLHQEDNHESFGLL